ncbi:MAG: hypothetical protein WAW52_04965 [Methanothrix sp.]
MRLSNEQEHAGNENFPSIFGDYRGDNSSARILPGGKATLWASGCCFTPYELRLLAALLHTPK